MCFSWEQGYRLSLATAPHPPGCTDPLGRQTARQAGGLLGAVCVGRPETNKCLFAVQSAMVDVCRKKQTNTRQRWRCETRVASGSARFRQATPRATRGCVECRVHCLVICRSAICHEDSAVCVRERCYSSLHLDERNNFILYFLLPLV